ncbi:MAG: PD-(D/E)XK nuclease family protein [Rubrivivax sp.]
MEGLVLAVAVAAVVLLAVLGRGLLHAAKVAADRNARPDSLRHAKLVYVERTFRIRHPIRLVARIDRAYRLNHGPLVLVELKSRWTDRPFDSDIIQLSAQRLAIEAGTGDKVETYAFVSVVHPFRGSVVRHHKVRLLEAAQLLELHRRREALLAEHVPAAYSRSTAACRACAFRARCDRPRRGVH